MVETNITDGLAGGIHMEMYQAVQATQRPFDPEKTSVPIASVAKYCVFLSNDDIAENANGSYITFNRNWPEA